MTAIAEPITVLDAEAMAEFQLPCEVTKPAIDEGTFLSFGGRQCENPAVMLNLVVCEICNDPRHTLNCLDCTASLQSGATQCRVCSAGQLSVLSSERL